MCDQPQVQQGPAMFFLQAHKVTGAREKHPRAGTEAVIKPSED